MHAALILASHVSSAWFRQQLYVSSHEQACRVCWRPNTCQYASGNKRINGTYYFLWRGPRSFQSYLSPAEFCSDLGLRICIKLHRLWKEWPLYSGTLSIVQKSELKPSRDGFTQRFKVKAPWHYMTQLQQSQLSVFFHLPPRIWASVFQAFCSALGAQWSVSLEFSYRGYGY